MSDNNTITFTKTQLSYLIQKTGATSAQEAVEIFGIIFTAERIDPAQMPMYLNRLMQKDGYGKE